VSSLDLFRPQISGGATRQQKSYEIRFNGRFIDQKCWTYVYILLQKLRTMVQN
jgi:hypothetical protein